MTRNELKKLARMRLREARALLKSRLYGGAYYLAGYAVECALKACIAKQTKQYEFPDKQRATSAFEHKPEKLIAVADLGDKLEAEKRRDPVFANHWQTVRAWGVERRYEIKAEAQDVQNLLQAIEDPSHGVLNWLQTYW